MLAPDDFRLFFSKYKLLLLVIVEVEVARIRLGKFALPELPSLTALKTGIS